jgi:hypothetical protein
MVFVIGVIGHFAAARAERIPVVSHYLCCGCDMSRKAPYVEKQTEA